MTSQQIMSLCRANQNIKNAQDNISKYEKQLREATEDKAEIIKSCDHLWMNDASALHYGFCQICEKEV